MLLRLILALVLALASPISPAAAHDGMSPMAMAGHAMPGMDHKAPMACEHVCIGCVPVGDWNTARIVAPIALPAPMPVTRIATLPLLPGEAPAPPPPRNA